MTKREFTKLAKQFGGWMEGDIARFPSVHQKEQFEKLISNEGECPHPFGPLANYQVAAEH